MKRFFVGELMTCCMCGKQEQSDPKRESQWRCLEVEENAYYACPDHFPDDRTATKWDYARAYDIFIAKCLDLEIERANHDQKR